MEAVKDTLMGAGAVVASVVGGAFLIALPFVAIGAGLAAGAKVFMWVLGV